LHMVKHNLPKSLRIRKIVLDHVQRGRMDFRKKNNIED